MGLSKEKGRFVERLKNPRFRAKERAFLVEGIRGAGEVVESPLAPGIRFGVVSPRYSRTQGGQELVGRLQRLGVPLETVTDVEMEGLSDTDRPQGVLLVVVEPEESMATLAASHPVRLLIMDGIQDPGNAGTLIRAARAFGTHGVFVLDGTVDPFNPKVVRASAGAVAHVPILRGGWEVARSWLQEREVPILVADPGGDDVRTFPPSRSWALVVGNEGAGPRTEILSHADGVVGVPMEEGVESLNAGVAGAILLFALSSPSRGTEEC